MSNGSKMIVVALAAFGLGFLVARQLAPGVEGPGGPDLTWRLDGQSLVLTPQAPDKSYLVVTSGEAAPPPGSSSGPITVHYQSGSINIAAGSEAVGIYAVTPRFFCERGECAPCVPEPAVKAQCGVPPVLGPGSSLLTGLRR